MVEIIGIVQISKTHTHTHTHTHTRTHTQTRTPNHQIKITLERVSEYENK